MDKRMRLRHISHLAFCFVLTLLLPQISRAIEILRPRGVSISRASLYNPDKDFTCLDGTLTIPFLYVNDDYCDCSDGSDEPGTPACPNGTFHCTNAGHQPLDIPSSRVNDGICDCCDGSDEFGSVGKRGGGSCSNTCLEMGRAAREEAQRWAELQREGAEMRRELARKGREMQAERSERLTQLRRDREEAEALKAEREAAKIMAEEKENAALASYREAEEIERQKTSEQLKNEEHEEALNIFISLDADQNGRVSVAEVQLRQTFDQNKDGQVTDDEARFFLGESEEVSEEEFVRDSWPRMKPFYMMETDTFTPPDRADQPIEEEEVEQTEGDKERNAGDVEREEEEEEEEEEEGEGEGDGEEGQVPPTDDGRQQDGIQYDDETQRLIEEATQARNDFEEADRALRDVQREVRQHEEALEKDFGPDQEFSPLDGECFEYTDREYVYKLCPFDQVSQRPKLGGSETQLGKWGQWVGPEHDKYARMMYDRGQGCWNGPQRSTLVVIICGTENQLVAVSEPNRCEYKFDFLTPAACRPPEAGAEDRAHDEL